MVMVNWSSLLPGREVNLNGVRGFVDMRDSRTYVHPIEPARGQLVV
jgi:hypothetical protein